MRISDWSSDVCSSDLRRCLDTSHRGDGLGRNYSASSGGWLVAGRNRGNIGRRVMALLASVAMSANGLAVTAGQAQEKGATASGLAPEIADGAKKMPRPNEHVSNREIGKAARWENGCKSGYC